MATNSTPGNVRYVRQIVLCATQEILGLLDASLASGECVLFVRVPKESHTFLGDYIIMTDETKDALTRLHNGDAAIAIPAMTMADLNSRRIVGDVIKVADLALAEHPADDDDTGVIPWLKSVGIVKTDHPSKWTAHREDALSIGLWFVEDGWKAMLLHSENAASCIVRGLKTRGDLRRLCRALGVELKEE